MMWLFVMRLRCLPGATFLNSLFRDLPNQELSGAKSELQEETVGVCSFYCACIISKASTNKKYENKMHIEPGKTIFLTLLQ